MTSVHRPPNLFWRLIRFMNQRVLLRTYKPEAPVGNLVLLLTTTGRKSGLPRVTPLQYEEDNGVIYVGAARGQEADWFRNIVANPQVGVQMKASRFCGVAEPITDPMRIADFLELRLKRHPQMIRAMLLSHGLLRADRAHLEQLAVNLALVAIRTDEGRV